MLHDLFTIGVNRKTSGGWIHLTPTVLWHLFKDTDGFILTEKEVRKKTDLKWNSERCLEADFSWSSTRRPPSKETMLPWLSTKVLTFSQLVSWRFRFACLFILIHPVKNLNSQLTHWELTLKLTVGSFWRHSVRSLWTHYMAHTVSLLWALCEFATHRKLAVSYLWDHTRVPTVVESHRKNCGYGKSWKIKKNIKSHGKLKILH